MNYWIRNKRDELLETLKRVRILIINEEEAREITGEALTHKAARAILSLGPETVVIKQGEHGAFLQGPELFFTCPAYPIDNVIDPTGAGDSFAGGFVGALARMTRVNDHNLRRAVVYGCVLASFTVEGFGVSGLAHASRSILARAEAISDAGFAHRTRRASAMMRGRDGPRRMGTPPGPAADPSRRRAQGCAPGAPPRDGTRLARYLAWTRRDTRKGARHDGRG
jgi:hypothetical protein